MWLVLCDVRVISVLGMNVMKGLAPGTLPPLKGIVTAASRTAGIHMHTDSWPPGFNLHSRCNCRIDGHPGKWKICPPRHHRRRHHHPLSLTQLTLWAPPPRQAENNSAPASRAVVTMTLLRNLSASRLPPSDPPLPSISLMTWRGPRLIKLNYLGFSFESDSDAEFRTRCGGFSFSGLLLDNGVKWTYGLRLIYLVLGGMLPTLPGADDIGCQKT